MLKYILPLILMLSSCSSGKERMEGERVDILNIDTIINSIVYDGKISLPKKTNNKYWQGDNNPFNKHIENFKLDAKLEDIKLKHINIGDAILLEKHKTPSSPIIIGNKIYILDAVGVLSARKLKDPREVIWSVNVIDRKNVNLFTGGKMQYYEGTIFITTGYDEIIAVSAKDMTIKWKKRIGAIPVSNPIPDNNYIFFITNDNKTYCLNQEDGHIMWIHSTVPKSTNIYKSPDPVIYGENDVIISYSSGEIYFLDKTIGKENKYFNINEYASNMDIMLNDIDATPIVRDSILYVYSNNGLFLAIDILSENILWQKDIGGVSDFWIADDFIYLMSKDNTLYCVYKDGRIKWSKQYDTEKYLSYNSVIMADDYLIMLNTDNKIIFASAENGEILLKKNLVRKSGNIPIIVNGKMYIVVFGKYDSKLIVI